MKLTSALTAITALLSSTGALAAGKIEVEVRYSKEMIDVGNLDLFMATWQKIYATDGNGRAVVTDNTYGAFGGGCMSHYDGPDNNARVIVNGAWGRVPGLGPHDSREALVQALWGVLKAVSDPTAWDVFTKCYGLTWQEGQPIWSNSRRPACGGGKFHTVRPTCLCSMGSAACENFSVGHRVPSIIKANLYRDGRLLADSLTVQFSAQRVVKDDGCKTVNTIAGLFGGLLPGPAALFASGISVFCGA
ncbi:hypothetical protein B0T11DRAFT_332103 [Plectosphaerella cucumerina]|uniref:Uncharacterized protein n=1 Tax=Plectosphaerella cucumerina TaxID=40658 RepID=A0A8K0TAF2_9PEZI|nr:hypothetical protein B0T11DRAFT_332103 [Plectosphaerella cucumerina]